MDDLFALAAALRVSPTTLLMPNAGDGDEQVAVTGITEECGAERLWKWLHVEEPIDPDDTGDARFPAGGAPGVEEEADQACRCELHRRMGPHHGGEAQ